LAAIAALIIPVVIFVNMPWARPDANRLERSFAANQHEFYIIAKYLTEARRDGWFSIRQNDVDSGSIPIRDEDVAQAVRTLFRQGYWNISTNKHGILFLYWRFFEQGIGIVHTFYDSNPGDAVFFPIEVLPLSEEGWYYYFD